jgi:hypothetical protein
VPCAPCFYRVCPIEHPCLRGLAAELVRGAILTLLDDRARHAATASVARGEARS